jgi:hypothetical protein
MQRPQTDRAIPPNSTATIVFWTLTEMIKKKILILAFPTSIIQQHPQARKQWVCISEMGGGGNGDRMIK